jgi:hypothetical protein
MIAIHTKYLPATNIKGSRIKAYTLNGHSATVSVDHALNGEIRHFEAVKALVAKHQLDWDLSDMVWGDSSDGKGYVFCFANSKVQA